MLYEVITEGRYTLVNSRYEELFEIRNEEIQGKTDHDIFPREIADRFRENDMRVLADGHPCQVEERVPQRDGMHVYLSVKFPLYDEEGAVNRVCGISTDITALKAAQVQLRRLSDGIMASQEKERAAVARELHDELGQVLTALRRITSYNVCYTKLLRDRPVRNPAPEERVPSFR